MRKYKSYLIPLGITLLLHNLFDTAFSSSPSFVRQEVKDGADDWYFYNLYGAEKSGKQYTEEKIDKHDWKYNRQYTIGKLSK